MEYCLFVPLITVLVTGGLGQDVYMVLGNKEIPEHSLVNHHAIGKSNETGLRCVTERVDCCIGDNGTRAEWFDPSNRTRGGGAFLRSRNGLGSAKGYVNLFTRTDSSHAQQGIYHCNIPAPSPSDDISTLYVGIYKNDDEGIPTITSITYDQLSSEIYTLTCISTGGPATTVTWTLNGSEVTYDVNHTLTQTVVNATTAEYNNTLTVTGREAGNYQCTVSNARGSDTSQLLLVNFTDTTTTTHMPPSNTIPTTVAPIPSPSSHLPSNATSLVLSPLPSPSDLPVAIAGAAVSLILIITLLVVLLLVLIVYKKKKGSWPLRKHQCSLLQNDDTKCSIKMSPSTGHTLTAVANDTIKNITYSSKVNANSSTHSHYYSTVKDSSDPLYSAINDTATPSADPLYSAVTEPPILMECIDPSYSLLTTNESDQTVQKEDKILSTGDSYSTKQGSKQASESITKDETKTSPGPGDVYAVVDKSKKVKRSAQSESRADPNTVETGGPAETNAVYAVVQKGLKKKSSPPPLPAPYKDITKIETFQ